LQNYGVEKYSLVLGL